jgi:hypothetical protein
MSITPKERGGWEKGRGDDPLSGKSIGELKKIENDRSNPNDLRHRAKKIRKQKEKKGIKGR